MGFKSISIAIATLTLSTSVNSATIALDDWWLQTDAFGGLRQSNTDASVFFAVSKFTTQNINDTYETPTGFHWATTAELHAVFDLTPIQASTHFENYTYFDHGGWDGYEWEGQARLYFKLADSVTSGAVMHAGSWEDRIWSYSHGTNAGGFAGLVLIQDTSVVPIPAAVWLFGSGLLGLVGVARRKKV